MKIGKLKKLLLSAAALAVAASMCSCGIIVFNPGHDSETEAPETEAGYKVTELEKYSEAYTDKINGFIQNVPQKDFGGASILVATPRAYMIIPDDNYGTVLSKEIAMRNTAVEEHLNIKLSVKLTDAATMAQEVRDSVRSGSYYADIIMFPQLYLGDYAADGCLTNINSLPGIKTGAEYFNQSSVVACGGSARTFAVASPASLDPSCLSAVFFNTSLVASTGLESPYKLVDEGNWTWDRFFQYTEALSSTEGTYYSYGAQNTSTFLADLVYFSCGASFVSQDENFTPYISYTAESAAPAVDMGARLLHDQTADTNAMTAIDTFSAGGSMFLIDKLSTMDALKDSGTQWGILPLPKYDAEQTEHITLVHNDDALVFGVLPTVTDTEKIASVLNVLSIASYGILADTYASNAMSYNLRDNESARMMARIMNGATYDFAYSFGVRYTAIPSATFVAVRNTIVGVSTLDGYLNAWTGRFNNAVYNIMNLK